jgi:hypothetical protein
MTNFKSSVIALAIGLFAVSCGSGTSNKQGGSATETKTEQAAPAASSSLEAKDVNPNNWQEVIKANKGGLALSLPQGWTVEKTDYSGRTIYMVVNIAGETTGEQFGQMLMDATKAASKNGNHKLEITERGATEGEAIEKLSEACMVKGEDVFNWCFTEAAGNQYVYQVIYSFDKAKAAFNI